MSGHHESSFVSFEDFLDDVKYQIKKQYGSQQAFADSIPVHRNVIVRVTNDVDRLNPYWINLFARTLNLDLRNYVFKREHGT